MNIAITLPDDVAEKLEQHWSDLPRHILESLVAALPGQSRRRPGVDDVPGARNLAQAADKGAASASPRS